MDDLEGAPLVVPNEVLHIFQNEGGRLVVIENFGDREEEVSLLFVLKAVLAAQTVFLGDAREAEWLTGKAAAEDVELRDVCHGNRVNVAMWRFTEVCRVGLLAELVPVTGENAARPGPLESNPKPADAAEEINEAKVTVHGGPIYSIWGCVFLEKLCRSFPVICISALCHSFWH